MLDPRNPDVLYAAAYQRRRHVWTLIDGGPESAIYKSHRRRRDLDEARRTGCPRRTWAASASRSSPVEPRRRLRDRRGRRTRPAASSARTDARRQLGEEERLRRRQPAVLPRALRRPAGRGPRLLDGHLHAGDRRRRQDLPNASARSTSTWTTTRCGSTRTTPTTCSRAATAASTRRFDRGATWAFFGEPAGHPVLPRGGRQRDAVLQRLRRHAGQQHARRPVAHAHRARHRATPTGSSRPGGDGFQPRVDPTDPNIVYAESQHGGLVRFDRRTGEQIDIQPQPGAGRAAAALELGLAAHHQPALATRGSTSRRSGCSAATTAATRWQRGQRRPHAPDRPQHSSR